MRRLLVWLGTALLALLTTVSGCVAVLSRDVRNASDADLTQLEPELDPANNAFTFLERAAGALAWSREGAESATPEWIERTHAANAPARAQVYLALAAPALRIPAKEHDRAEADMQRFQRLALLFAAEAIWQAHHEQTRASLQAGIDAVRLGDVVLLGHGVSLMHMRKALDMKAIGLRAIQSVLPLLPIEAADARWLAESLTEHRLPAGGWSRMWAAEYRRFKRSLIGGSPEGPFSASAFQGLLPASYTFQRNRTLALYAELIRAEQGESALPCGQLRAPEPKPFEELSLLYQRNGGGQLAVRRQAREYYRDQILRCLSQTDVAATETLGALRAYERKHGTLPDSLEELVPDYTASLASDGFADQPLRYGPDERLLYPTGAEGSDRASNPSYEIPKSPPNASLVQPVQDD